MPTLDDRLLPVFLRQHWLVSTSDVVDAGGTGQQARDRVRSGRWIQVDRGVFRPRDLAMTWHSRHLAPILAGRLHGVEVRTTHRSAAALHQIPGFGRGHPEVATPRGYNIRRTDLRVRTSTDLDRAGTIEVEGLPVTDLCRTILDVGHGVSDQRLLRIVEWARRERGITWAQMISTLARHARRGRAGIARLRRVIAHHADREEITDSDFELLVLALLREHGLPEPVLHHRVLDGTRFVAEVDLAYPSHLLAIELDGAVHLEADVRERDLPRQNDLVLLGWTVLRFTWRRLQERPDALVREVRAALATRRLSPAA
jgi:very-short-patch-repair endonuclease